MSRDVEKMNQNTNKTTITMLIAITTTTRRNRKEEKNCKNVGMLVTHMYLQYSNTSNTWK